MLQEIFQLRKFNLHLSRKNFFFRRIHAKTGSSTVTWLQTHNSNVLTWWQKLLQWGIKRIWLGQSPVRLNAETWRDKVGLNGAGRNGIGRNWSKAEKKKKRVKLGQSCLIKQNSQKTHRIGRKRREWSSETGQEKGKRKRKLGRLSSCSQRTLI